MQYVPIAAPELLCKPACTAHGDEGGGGRLCGACGDSDGKQGMNN